MGNSLCQLQIEWARESASQKALASKRCQTQSLLVCNLHCMSSMLLAKEATAKEGTIILDVVKIDLVG